MTLMGHEALVGIMPATVFAGAASNIAAFSPGILSAHNEKHCI